MVIVAGRSTRSLGVLMTARELEEKYWPHIRKVGGLNVFPAEIAIRLLQDSASMDVRLMGVEAFRISEDGTVEPSMEFSNISYGKVESGEFHARFGRHEGWRQDPNPLQRTQALIAAGAAQGYSWFEVYLEDWRANDRALFQQDA